MSEALAEYSTHRILAVSGAVDGWVFTHGNILSVVAVWADAEGYESWLRHPLREESAVRLTPLVDEVICSYLADRAEAAW